MTIKSKQLLLDANVIIKAHEIEVWNVLLRKADVAVTSIIAHEESLFFSKEAGLVPAPISITAPIEQGAISELSASISDIARVRAVFDEERNMALHDGEVEAIAILYADESDSLLFCTSDKVAIRVLAMLGLSDSGVSFEEVLKATGLSKPLPHEYCAEYFNRYIEKGKTARIQGEGIPYD